MPSRLVVAAAVALWVFWLFGEMFGTIGIVVLGLCAAVTIFFVRPTVPSLPLAQCFVDFLRRCRLFPFRRIFNAFLAR
jgi:hypothetical protein